MKIAVIIVRILVGALYLFASVMFFLQLAPQPELQGDMKLYMQGMMASHYLLPVVKVIELVCGIAFVTGFFVPLAAVIIFPITVNIVCVHAFLAPEGLPMAIAILAGNLFLAWAYRERYAPLFVARPKLVGKQEEKQLV